MITIPQLRAAQAFTGLPNKTVAFKLGVTMNCYKRILSGRKFLTPQLSDEIEEVFLAYGVIFTEDEGIAPKK